MFSRAELLARYEALSRAAAGIAPVIDEVLRTYAGGHHYLYDSRIKDRESYFQKLETGREGSSDIDDLFACSLIVPTTEEVARCEAALPSAVRIMSRRGPDGRRKEPETFRFDELILICKLDRAGAEPLGPFEVQIKTITIHAWSSATHGLVYKGDAIDWRRERLSAQLRAHAEEADLMYAHFVDLAKRLQLSQSSRYQQYRQIDRGIQRWSDKGLWPSELQPVSRVRFVQSIADLAAALNLNLALLLRDTEIWLASNGHPASLTTFEVVLGVASGLVQDWSATDSRHRLLVTQDLLDTFPAAQHVPADRMVELGT